MTSVMAIASTRLQNSEPNDASRSRSRYRGAVSYGNASVTWLKKAPTVVAVLKILAVIYGLAMYRDAGAFYVIFIVRGWAEGPSQLLKT